MRQGRVCDYLHQQDLMVSDVTTLKPPRAGDKPIPAHQLGAPAHLTIVLVVLVVVVTPDRAAFQSQKEAPMTVTDLAVLPNLRDLGGLSTADQRRTRAGVLYRSALPAPGDARPATVAEWPARTVVDLRSPRECAARAHPLQSDATAVHQISLLTDTEATAPSQAIKLADIYQAILTNAGVRLAEVLQLAATAPGPVLVHCAAGKDRTGIAVALLLRIAGVDPGDVVDDYVATNDHMDAVLARITRFAPELGQTHPHDRDLLGADPEAIERVLSLWDAHPDGVHGWVREYGATEDAIGLWSERFIE